MSALMMFLPERPANVNLNNHIDESTAEIAVQAATNALILAIGLRRTQGTSYHWINPGTDKLHAWTVDGRGDLIRSIH
jgi:uncharacterized protein YjdB